MEKADRASSAKAKEVFEELFRIQLRERHIFGFSPIQSWKRIHWLQPDGPKLLTRDFVRLNVGMIEVTSIRKKRGLAVSYALSTSSQ